MRFAASPLLVAVALGLLGPAALDAEEDDLEGIASESTSSSMPGAADGQEDPYARPSSAHES
ncbi:MAG: hypothetical protein V4850_18560 [Myxococcota bacterium]